MAFSILIELANLETMKYEPGSLFPNKDIWKRGHRDIYAVFVLLLLLLLIYYYYSQNFNFKNKTFLSYIK